MEHVLGKLVDSLINAGPFGVLLLLTLYAGWRGVKWVTPFVERLVGDHLSFLKETATTNKEILAALEVQAETNRQTAAAMARLNQIGMHEIKALAQIRETQERHGETLEDHGRKLDDHGQRLAGISDELRGKESS